ncbi:hypothetical protein LZZ85_23800 [Terrimonas sp. NA20]|uniref:Uncharacterized protein n=1 Tax=Terrimonas ginsenosidimutans TaxID=2908004 RepID=A0ABS9KYN7_9BACT|nr:hypothetical protein [Terrimonas ginsenosidimutans]MCG2617342.1 hypothetical protein [Terrimonas ginsenosidimutans]
MRSIFRMGRKSMPKVAFPFQRVAQGAGEGGKRQQKMRSIHFLASVAIFAELSYTSLPLS